MGLLLKVVLFGLVFYYIVKTIGSFVFRILGGQSRQNQRQQTATHKREGEINIEYMPKNQKGRSSSGKKGGDYIDFEEVK